MSSLFDEDTDTSDEGVISEDTSVTAAQVDDDEETGAKNETADKESDTSDTSSEADKSTAVVPEKRYKDAQAAFTKASMENAELRKKIEALETREPSKETEAKKPSKTAKDIGNFDDAEFERIAEEHGRGAAFAYMQEKAKEAAIATVEEKLTARDAEAKLKARDEANAEAAMSLFDEHGYSEELYGTMRKLGEKEAKAGFILSPGALYALAEAGGDWNKVISIIRGSKAEVKPDEDDGEVEKPKKKHPGVPGGSSSRSPASSSAKSHSGVNMRDLGII